MRLHGIILFPMAMAMRLVTALVMALVGEIHEGPNVSFRADKQFVPGNDYGRTWNLFARNWWRAY